MRQLTCTAPGVIEWCDVPEPQLLEPTDALVRPIAVARCEIDPFLVLAGPTRADRFALGHEAVTEIVAVGDAVTDVAVGQLALPAFQVSCGSCPQCRRGTSAICERYPILSDYGMEPLSGIEYGGMLSDLDGPFAGARVHESGRLVDADRSCFEGGIDILPASVGN